LWIIKNNWGKRWGDADYAKIARPSSLTGKYETMRYLIDDIGHMIAQNKGKKKKLRETT
jgi:C1A family cysteine protease